MRFQGKEACTAICSLHIHLSKLMQISGKHDHSTCIWFIQHSITLSDHKYNTLWSMLKDEGSIFNLWKNIFFQIDKVIYIIKLIFMMNLVGSTLCCPTIWIFSYWWSNILTSDKPKTTYIFFIEGIMLSKSKRTESARFIKLHKSALVRKGGRRVI